MELEIRRVMAADAAYPTALRRMCTTRRSIENQAARGLYGSLGVTAETSIMYASKL